MRTLVAASAAVALCWSSASAAESGSGAAKPARRRGVSEAAARADCEKVLNFLLPFAEKMLREQGAFLPFAGGLNRRGKVALVAALAGKEQQQDPGELMKLLVAGLQGGAKKGDYTATGLLIDGRVVPPGQQEKTDAIIARLDHASGYSVELFVPYRFDENKQPLFGAMFGIPGKKEIFRQSK